MESTLAPSAPSCGKTKDPIFQLCDIVRETAYAIHCYLKNGHLEKVYENALVHRLRKQGIAVEKQLPIVVRDQDGTVLGEFAADALVADALVVEMKACRALVDEHVAQALGYLRATGIEHALLYQLWRIQAADQKARSKSKERLNRFILPQ